MSGREMRAMIQRVTEASVTVDGQITGAIQKGLMVLLGVKQGDTRDDLEWLAEKCINLRIFENEEGKFHYSLLDVAGSVLVVSQFTLYGDCRKGRRPSFTDAALPEEASAMYEAFIYYLKEKQLTVETGIFGAMMQVHLINDGPVTIQLDSEDRRR